jgi:hypothetical protein
MSRRMKGWWLEMRRESGDADKKVVKEGKREKFFPVNFDGMMR